MKSKAGYEVSKKAPSGQLIDLVFMLEASENMLNYNWVTVTEWVSKMIEDIKYEQGYSSLESMVIVIRFESYESQTMSRLVEMRRQQMEKATGVTVVVEQLDGTDSYDALNDVNMVYYVQLRQQAKKVFISLTDGMYRSRSSAKSDSAKAAVVKETLRLFDAVFALGYGSSVDEEELAFWTDENANYDSAFLMESVDQLSELTDALIESMNVALSL